MVFPFDKTINNINIFSNYFQKRYKFAILHLGWCIDLKSDHICKFNDNSWFSKDFGTGAFKFYIYQTFLRSKCDVRSSCYRLPKSQFVETLASTASLFSATISSLTQMIRYRVPKAWCCGMKRFVTWSNVLCLSDIMAWHENWSLWNTQHTKFEENVLELCQCQQRMEQILAFWKQHQC